ncbi:MAG TPA: hypothetical protein VF256_05385 [Streptosporangiaceae bacterium]
MDLPPVPVQGAKGDPALDLRHPGNGPLAASGPAPGTGSRRRGRYA